MVAGREGRPGRACIPAGGRTWPIMTLGSRASLTAPKPYQGEDLLPNPSCGFSPFRSNHHIQCSEGFPGLGSTPLPIVLPINAPCSVGAPSFLRLPPPHNATGALGGRPFYPLAHPLRGHHPGQLPIRCPCAPSSIVLASGHVFSKPGPLLL